MAIGAATYWPIIKFGTVRGDVLRYIELLQSVGMVLQLGTRYK